MREHGLAVGGHSFNLDVEIRHRRKKPSELILDRLAAFQPPDHRPYLNNVLGIKHTQRIRITIVKALEQAVNERGWRDGVDGAHRVLLIRDLRGEPTVG